MDSEVKGYQALERRKRRLRRWLSSLSIEDKIACLVQMQKRANGIKPDWPVWKIEKEIAGHGLSCQKCVKKRTMIKL